MFKCIKYSEDNKQFKKQYLFTDDKGNINSLFIVIFFSIIIIGTLFYFISNPYYEKISCDENLYCTVEHKYFEDYGYSEHFKISPKSYLEFKLGNYCYFHSSNGKYHFFKKHDIRHIYLNIFDGRKMKSPFKSYIDTVDLKHPDYTKLSDGVEKAKFDQYINNPLLKYNYENYNDIYNIFIFAGLMFALAFPIMFIIEFLYGKLS